jgi:hypothetical protein
MNTFCRQPKAFRFRSSPTAAQVGFVVHCWVGGVLFDLVEREINIRFDNRRVAYDFGELRINQPVMFLLSNFQKRVYHSCRFMLFTLTTRYAKPADQPAGQGTHVIMGSG